MKIHQGIGLLLILGAIFFLNGCISGAWTGASLIYDRHNLYKKIDDYSLSLMANKELNYDRLFQSSECVLDIGTFNGDLLIAGHVSSSELKQKAIRRLEKLPYRDYFHYITVSNRGSNNLADIWTTTKIKSLIIADSDINPNDFKIMTVDNNVYIMGDVQPSQAQKVLAIAKETTDVEKVVSLMRYYNLSKPRVTEPSASGSATFPLPNGRGTERH